ncbi:DUF2062 domain-containing protein [Chryseobacterium sp. MFBS3-17]|uniref:DUF2062 domain-containing protein n=1 Tax=Chryseobacterium sp. MFBS3-17 TaxID=2886689 RepID=UPI001D0F28DE|nr:DUF2062 domain-containing protein [Chryseobacterium sp. MFBS3-17]MCC2591309.1 DUF2062 domain-containing protein [Chryseobacterium sp. MFBS3-17]
MTPDETRITLKHHRICILIPTYNNCKTLERVLNGVLAYTDDILVINDGSTDDTHEILSRYPALHTIHLLQNKGKGNALRVGFREARKLGFHHAITLDSDGQHYPDDIPVFVEALQEEKGDVLLVGDRNMAAGGIPKKSSFGNRISSFWLWFETGIRLQDTQSGYRLYPLHKIPQKFYTPKFEFEIEIMVRTAWKGVPLKNIPVRVLYDPAERVSHFRPVKDFARISVLNIVLVFITIFYIAPRNFIRNFRKKSFRQFVKEDVLESSGSNRSKALSIALGTFIGLTPLFGLHTLLTISLAVLLKLNKLLAFAFSNLSIPPFIPFIIFISLSIGGFITGHSVSLTDTELNWDLVKQHFLQYAIGSFVLATTTSIVLGTGFYLFLEQVNPERKKQN